MAPTSTKSLAHFMHPAHRLTELTANTPFNCDGCKITGTGTRFTCTICKFNLHNRCAKCPKNWDIFTPDHPHKLSLFVHKPKFHRTKPCGICHSSVEGLAYQCKGCKYLVHPLCVSTGNDSQRIDPHDVIELAGLAADLTNHVKEDGDRFNFGTSNASNGYEAPSSHSSGSRTSGGDDHGDIVESITRGIGHLFES